MADFSTPFASNGELRLPSSDETNLGFQCGPADRELFNKMFNRLEAEMNSIISEAGTPQSNDSDNSVVTAILALINAATGGDPAGLILFDQARSRLPIFPDVTSNSSGIFNVTSPSTGVIRIPGGISFNHRGIFQITTSETDLTTIANKIYHLRWNPDNGFELKDLSDLTYNPDSDPETDSSFDTSYDDMLVARIVTNSSNIVTITNLSNLSNLRSLHADSYSFANMGPNTASERVTQTHELNWSRTPFVMITGGGTNTATGSAGGWDVGYTDINDRTEISRYSVLTKIQAFNNRPTEQTITVGYQLSFIN